MRMGSWITAAFGSLALKLWNHARGAGPGVVNTFGFEELWIEDDVAYDGVYIVAFVFFVVVLIFRIHLLGVFVEPFT